MPRILAVVLVAALLTGCANVIHGSRQDIRVISIPSGAIVRENFKNQATTTPGVLTVDRKKTSYVLTFEKEGYKPVEVSLKRTIDGWLWGNILLGLYGIVFGIAIDFSSGAAYKLTPGEVNVVLDQQQKASLRRNRDTLVVFADMEKLPQEIREKIIHRRDNEKS